MQIKRMKEQKTFNNIGFPILVQDNHLQEALLFASELRFKGQKRRFPSRFIQFRRIPKF